MDPNDEQPPPPNMGQQPNMPPPPVYGYPVDPSWNAWQAGMMPPHHGYAPQGYHPVYYTGGMEGILPSGIPGFGASHDPLESILGPFPCVQIKGLPFEVTLEDIISFFQGFVILDILLRKEQREAFVVFTNPMDYQMALARDRQNLGLQIVEVVAGTRAGYYAAAAKQHAEKVAEEKPMVDTSKLDQVLPPNPGGFPWPIQSSGQGQYGGHSAGRGAGRGMGPPRRAGGGIQVGEHTGYLRMRGLPFTTTKDEIAEFFSGYNVLPDSIVLTYRNDGRATGEGYIGFATPDDSKAAMALHRNTMGSRYIELFISNKDEHTRAYNRFSGRSSSS